ncbi:MAG TPA: hypothetical protein VNS49_27040 [Streptomyces sp.]|nr:hypothetical protein [Streptomyces sp.]
MSAAFQAIINGVRADVLGASPTPMGLWGHTRWAFAQLGIRPRDRRPALAIRQDA